MQPLSDIELEALLDDLESDRIERKQSWSDDAADKACQAVCAFANDLPNHDKPGILFVGALDNGKPSGLPITDRLLTAIADIRSNGNILPPPTLTVEKRILKGAPMAVVTVQPADAPPVRYKGRIWIRTGPRRALASAQEERILNERRRYRDRHFDVHPLSSCPLSELSRVAFEHEYLPQAFAPDVLAANERSYEERLASTGMIASIEDPTPTVLGVLALARTPRHWLPCDYIQFLRIRGTEWGDPVADALDIDGPLARMIERLDDKLRAYLTTSVDFTSADREIRRRPYPLAALQQFARNAVMHRAYEGTNAPVHVYWFDDRIEIRNPGGPYGSVTPENFGKPGKVDYRNPNLAGVMRTLGLVQRFGLGIADARKALHENGNPAPEFEVDSTAVRVIVRMANAPTGQFP
jgi:ATP-dependent DNA helicase RecG